MLTGSEKGDPEQCPPIARGSTAKKYQAQVSTVLSFWAPQEAYFTKPLLSR